MKWVTCHDGRLQVQAGIGDSATDGHAPGPDVAGRMFMALPRRAVHELLFDPAELPPVLPALACVRGALDASAAEPGRAVVWCDGEETLYPPALAAAGIPLERLYLVRPKPADLVSVVVDSLRCGGVGAVVATLPPRLTRPEARRMQLAAEQGGGLALLLRTTGRGADVYAAATRWAVSPAPGERDLQRWTIQLSHGLGQTADEPFLLEVSRVSAALRVVVRSVGARSVLPRSLDARPVRPDAFASRAVGDDGAGAHVLGIGAAADAVPLHSPAALAAGPAAATDARALA